MSRPAGAGVRLAEAEDLTTPSDRLAALAGDDSPRVRSAVASNPSADASALLALAQDPDRRVRWTVALHGNLDAAAQRVLAADADARVRGNLAGRDDLLPEVVDLLRRDQDKNVCTVLAAHATDPALIADLLVDARPEVRAGLAVGNWLLTEDQVRLLAADRSAQVRAALARGRGARLPVDVLEALARDVSVAVRWNLTVTRMPPSVLAILVEDPDEMNRANASQWTRGV